ncbi:hypothetical protein DL95DRAFT_396270 [Leptodontidium sp. 2 PMI_412]|nr:hypothetical protein DL95DRAFT_396270 [Leptodontidium sp. 2 PMI_412]
MESTSTYATEYIVSDNHSVASWLATSAAWLDPAEPQLKEQPFALDQHNDASPATAIATTTTPSPGSLFAFVSRGRSPGRKRRRRQGGEGDGVNECGRRRRRRVQVHSASTRTSSMNNDDTASIASGLTSATSSAAIDRREILTAVGPSRKRTGSPVRHQLTQLQRASPPLLICQPGSSVVLPPAVSAMKKHFVQAASRNVIPRGLEDKLREQDDDHFEASAHLLEPVSTIRDPSYLTSLWQTVDNIYDEAENACNEHYDESMWIEVVRSVLKASHSPNLELHSMQTQSIKPSLIPRHAHLSFDKKADLALFFSPKKYPAIRRVYKCRPGLALSHMMDASTSQRPVHAVWK